MSEQAQFWFLFDEQPQKQFPELLSPGIIEARNIERARIIQEIEGEEIADPPEVVLEQPTKRELERDGQMALIDVGEWWEEHWKGMPEFVQKDLTPFKTIYVHFESREEMNKFAALVGQTITLNTRSIWYPEAEIGRFADKRYVDKPPEEETDGIDVVDEE